MSNSDSGKLKGNILLRPFKYIIKYLSSDRQELVKPYIRTKSDRKPSQSKIEESISPDFFNVTITATQNMANHIENIVGLRMTQETQVLLDTISNQYKSIISIQNSINERINENSSAIKELRTMMSSCIEPIKSINKAIESNLIILRNLNGETKNEISNIRTDMNADNLKRIEVNNKQLSTIIEISKKISEIQFNLISKEPFPKQFQLQVVDIDHLKSTEKKIDLIEKQEVEPKKITTEQLVEQSESALQ